MHVLLYSRSFPPALGGVETVSQTLAEQITAAGHDCTVVTETPASTPGMAWAFPVIRAPRAGARLSLARSADLVHSNGASLALFPFAKLARKPFVWTHAGYQLVAIDGLGWLDDGPAPLSPVPSVLFHARRRGMGAAVVGAAKLGLRRLVGRLVDRNVAVSRWVAERQPLANQEVIHNPFPLQRFRSHAATSEPTDDFIFVGRLVSEKGVRTLLHALAALNGRSGRRPATLLVVGDGPERPALERLAGALGLGATARFLGERRGEALRQAIARAAIGVVPSEWEEPMGGVALELLAAGRPVIVSEWGGLAECVGEAAWTFPNGDAAALAVLMAALLDDERLRGSKRQAAARILADFDERRLAARYLALYEDVLAGRQGASPPRRSVSSRSPARSGP